MVKYMSWINEIWYTTHNSISFIYKEHFWISKRKNKSIKIPIEKLGHQCVCVYIYIHSRLWLFVTPWTVAYQAPQFMEFSRWEYWSGLPFPPPWDLPDPGTEPRSPALQVDTLLSEPPGKASHCICISNYHNVHFKYLIILYINYA